MVQFFPPIPYNTAVIHFSCPYSVTTQHVGIVIAVVFWSRIKMRKIKHFILSSFIPSLMYSIFSWRPDFLTYAIFLFPKEILVIFLSGQVCWSWSLPVLVYLTKYLFLTHFWRLISPAYRIIGWWVFFFQYFEIFHSVCSVCNFSDEKSTVFSVFIPHWKSSLCLWFSAIWIKSA